MSSLAGIAAHEVAVSSRRGIRKTYSRAALSKPVSPQPDSDEDELALPTPSRRPDRRSKFVVRSEDEESKDSTVTGSPATARLPNTPRPQGRSSPPSRKRKLHTGPLFLTKLNQDHDLEQSGKETDKGIDTLSTDELAADESSNPVSPSDRKRVKQATPKPAMASGPVSEARPKKKVRFVLEPKDEFRHPPKSSTRNRRDLLVEGDGFDGNKGTSKTWPSSTLKVKKQQVPPESSAAESDLKAQKTTVATEFRALSLTSESRTILPIEKVAMQKPSQNGQFKRHGGANDWQEQLKADENARDCYNAIPPGAGNEQMDAMLLDDQHSGRLQGLSSVPWCETSNGGKSREDLQGDPDSEVHIS